MVNYTYKDPKDGAVYPAHTNTAQVPVETGAELRYEIMEGGDQTVCTKKVLPIGPLGSSRLA